MSQTARVLVSERPGSRATGLGAALQSHGCAVTNVAAADDVPFRAAQDLPDVVVLDGALPKATRTRVAHALRRDEGTRLIPMIVAGARDAGDVDGLDIALPRHFADSDLIARVHAVRRLAVMRQELERRIATAAKFGFSTFVDTDLAEGPSRLRLVAIAPSNDELALLRATTNGHGSVEIVDTLDATGPLSRRDHDAAFLFAHADAEAALDACERIRRVPTLFHFPLVLLAPPSAFKDPAEAYHRGASDLVTTPCEAEALRVRVRSLVRQERFRDYLQNAYREGLGLTVMDGLTGLFRYGFAHEHLAAQIHDHGQTRQDLSVAVIRILDLNAINRTADYATGDRVLRQVGAMIGRLIRAEYFAARISGATFGVAMPGTPIEAARAVCRRMASVIANTDVGLGRPELDGLTVAVGCADARPGDSPADLFERAAATPI
ncbi:MAG: diguanylate cyclase [Alphaproteobacteria bacterium]|nr:diguanylate cyclase [Alphaproteobacteria bacterium]